MQFIAAAYAWALAHGPAIAAFLVVVLPSVITGLSSYPRAGDGVIGVFKVLLSVASWVTHHDSPGTFKVPLSLPLPPGAKPSRGFAPLPVLVALVALAAALLATSAFAQDAPAPVNATAPSAEPQRLVGGCLKGGRICFGPAIAISTAAWDITHRRVITSLSPGLGYGVTFNQGKWDAFGFDFYVSLKSGGPLEGLTFGGMAKFASGYIRVGFMREILVAGPATSSVPISFGIDL
jgi:hypothetical protein